MAVFKGGFHSPYESPSIEPTQALDSRLWGTTLAPLVRALNFSGFVSTRPATLSAAEARARVAAAEAATVDKLSAQADGKQRHPRLVEQYGHRARLAARFSEASGALESERLAHFSVVLAAIAAGRAELLRLHRSGELDDSVLQALEHELDLEELRTRRITDGEAPDP